MCMISRVAAVALERTKGWETELSDDFVVMSLYVVIPISMQVLNAFQTQYPNVVVRYVVSDLICR